jgi:hypothetical protein
MTGENSRVQRRRQKVFGLLVAGRCGKLQTETTTKEKYSENGQKTEVIQADQAEDIGEQKQDVERTDNSGTWGTPLSSMNSSDQEDFPGSGQPGQLFEQVRNEGQDH